MSYRKRKALKTIKRKLRPLKQKLAILLGKISVLLYKLIKKSYTVAYIPHKKNNMKMINIPYSLSALVIFVFALAVFLSFDVVVNNSMKDNEVLFLNNRRNEYEEKIKIIEEKTVTYLKKTNYRKDLHKLLVTAGYIKANEPILALGGIDENITNTDDYIPEEILQMENLRAELNVSRTMLDNLEKKMESRKHFLDNVPNIWPIANMQGKIVRAYNNDEKDDKEKGIYISTLPGSPVRATASGKILKKTYNKRDKAFMVIIEHEYGFKTIYRGLGRTLIKDKREVEKGEVIGYTESGGIKRKFFKYQIMIASSIVDPGEYISSKY